MGQNNIAPWTDLFTRAKGIIGTRHLHSKMYLLYNLIMKTLLIFALFFGIVAISAFNAMAQSITIPNPLGSGGKDIPTLIDTIATWLLEIGTTIAVIIVIWAAFLFMTSGGNQEKVTMARKTLWYAIIGLALLILAKGVTSIIQNLLSGN